MGKPAVGGKNMGDEERKSLVTLPIPRLWLDSDMLSKYVTLRSNIEFHPWSTTFHTSERYACTLSFHAVEMVHREEPPGDAKLLPSNVFLRG